MYSLGCALGRRPEGEEAVQMKPAERGVVLGVQRCVSGVERVARAQNLRGAMGDWAVVDDGGGGDGGGGDGGGSRGGGAETAVESG